MVGYRSAHLGNRPVQLPLYLLQDRNEGAQYSKLPIADYLRMARVFVDLGIRKIMLTGGEPLLRKGLIELISELAKLRGRPDGGPPDLTVTTNGHLLEDQAASLKAAGLSRITASMDAVDTETFTRITRVPGSFEKVQRGIRATQEAGLGPIKINSVVLRGFNEDQIVPFAKFSREQGAIVRFIEFMPLEEDRIWTTETVVSLPEVVNSSGEISPHCKVASQCIRRDGVTLHLRQWHGRDCHHRTRVQAFCGHCSRIRLTSEGKIRTCLSSQIDHEL
jgi:GTP 3',8-cyclase